MRQMQYSAAAERNQDPILEILREVFADRREVLEIGSGTGQHAVYFSAALPQLRWQPSDRPEVLPGLAAGLAANAPPNCRAAVGLDVTTADWAVFPVDAVFTANTLHIMSWEAVIACFQGIGRILSAEGKLCVYGPFRYAGEFTTPSNAAFDRSLRQRDPASGIRDIEAVCDLAAAQDMVLLADHAMPANNQLLVWQRSRQGQ